MNTTPAALRSDLCATIVARVEDPAAWLLACRRIAVAAGLNPARCLPLGVALDKVVGAMVEAAVNGACAPGFEQAMRDAAHAL